MERGPFNDRKAEPAMSHVSITTGGVDVRLLRKQRNWVLTLPACDEREGLTSLLDHLLDRAEGYPDTLAGAARSRSTSGSERRLSSATRLSATLLSAVFPR